MANQQSSNPNRPRIVYNDATSIRAMFPGNAPFAIDGFRAGGQCSAPFTYAPLVTLDRASTVSYVYATQRYGFGEPALTAPLPLMWVAVFGVRTNYAPQIGIATLRFVPFLKVVSWVAATGVLTFDPTVGAAVVQAFAGVNALICQEGGVFSWKTTTVVSNTATTVTLTDRTLALVAGDFVLLAPIVDDQNGAQFKYLTTLAVDRNVALVPPYEFRKFTQCGETTFMFPGLANIPVSTANINTIVENSLADIVAPLATSARLTLQAFRNVADGATAYIYISRDATLQLVNRVGVDRTSVVNDGVTSGAFVSPLEPKQSVWASTNDVGTSGFIRVSGWGED